MGAYGVRDVDLIRAIDDDKSLENDQHVTLKIAKLPDLGLGQVLERILMEIETFFLDGFQ